MRTHLANSTALLLTLLLLAGCGANRSTHPGAVDRFDSEAYDLLLTTQNALSAANGEIDNIPVAYRRQYIDLVNNVGAAYNIARNAWTVYRNAVIVTHLGSEPTDLTQLRNSLELSTNALNSALLALFGDSQ
jgi:hypothetical protein